MNASPGSRHELCGLVSFGYLGCALRKTPNVFTRVSQYLEWIYDDIFHSEGLCSLDDG